MDINDEKKFTRVMAIDYLKAIAVILVILTHALSKTQRLKIGGPFWISMAVPIFMIISGFTNTLSADKNNIDSLSQYFTKEELIPKLLRVILPYLVIVLLELLLGIFQEVIFNTGPFISFSLKDFIFYFLTGGTTPGSYYILILIQFIFLYPFMFLAFKKLGKNSIILFFLVHLIFDALTTYLPIPAELYRVSIFRYLAFIVMGIALYYSYHTIRKYTGWLTILSVIYIWTYAYLGYIPKLFSKWTNTSLPIVFWALYLVILGMKYLEKENRNLVTYLFSRIGKASYHIFLVQKIIFGFGLNKLFNSMNLNIFLSSIISIILSCFLGIVFYDIEFEKNISDKDEYYATSERYQR